MPKDIRNQQKVNKRVVLAAINALRKKGWDINPDTVADEAQVSRSLVYHNPEVMDLVAQARTHSYDHPQTRIASLEDHICELQETIKRLQAENQALLAAHESGGDNAFGIPEGQQTTSQSQAMGKVDSEPQLHQEGDHWQDKSSSQSESDIYNAFKLGQVHSSRLLGDLSWKDLETVYNFSGGLLKDYATHVSFLVDGKPGPRQAEVTSSDDKSQDFADSEGQAKPDVTNEPRPAGSQGKVDSCQQNVFLREEDPRAHAAHVLAEAQAFAEAGVKALAEAEARVRARTRMQAQQEGKEDVHEEIPTGSHRSSDISSEANAGAYDLDKLDIFEGLENIDLKGIEVIEDVDFEQVDSPNVSGDELRELLKNRIKQASELPEQPVREPVPPLEQSESGRVTPRSKFVGTAKLPQDPPSHGFIVRQVPPDIRKACLILGVRPEKLTREVVLEAWKRQIASPGVHPDLGGDTEAAVFLNTAKDQLIRWLDARAPKLGKKFGNYKTNPKRSPSNGMSDFDSNTDR